MPRSCHQNGLLCFERRVLKLSHVLCNSYTRGLGRIYPSCIPGTVRRAFVTKNAGGPQKRSCSAHCKLISAVNYSPGSEGLLGVSDVLQFQVFPSFSYLRAALILTYIGQNTDSDGYGVLLDVTAGNAFKEFPVTRAGRIYDVLVRKNSLNFVGPNLQCFIDQYIAFLFYSLFVYLHDEVEYVSFIERA